MQLEVSHDSFPVTRRPLTISSISGSSVEIIFEAVGRGTGLLAGTDTGSSLRLLGPLGCGYRLNPGKWLLIGGGLGAAGFHGLAASIECGLLLLGASSQDKLLTIPGIETLTVTEDGSSGRKGLVTDLLETVRWGSFSSIALCGPVPMMKAVIELMPPQARTITQVSAEARMGCGWGACEGCSVPKAGGGFLKCCSDGPVFPADTIDWKLWEGIH
ncbi:MAG: NAD-dependent dihydroorotate dehydrogenase B electron transfer subunit [Candidatus Fermentibacteria bacterium]